MSLFLGLAAFLALGFLLFYLALSTAKRRMRKRVSVRSLLTNFHQKIYMTAGIGSFFCLFYFSSVYLLSLWIETKGRLNCFNFILSHLVEFIYLGLAAFTTITITIYLLRMVIKARYNSKRRL